MRRGECDRIEEMLPLYAGGELSEAEAAEVAGHIDRCPGCARSLETFMSLERSLSGMPALVPDAEEVAGAVMDRLGLGRRRGLAPVFSRLSLAWSVAVATAALVLLVTRFDYASAILSGQERFIESAGRTMDGWISSSSAVIADFFTQVEATLATDPWLLAAGLTGFGMVIFAAGMMAALRGLR